MARWPGTRSLQGYLTVTWLAVVATQATTRGKTLKPFSITLVFRIRMKRISNVTKTHGNNYGRTISL